MLFRKTSFGKYEISVNFIQHHFFIGGIHEPMGLRRHHIIWHVLLAESLPAIIGGMTVCVVVMIGSSAMAGAVGAGGLGDLAIRYGYERYETKVLFDIILILIAMVSIVQFAGEKLARRVDHR
jgi:D-methionine transport system permease protein